MQRACLLASMVAVVDDFCPDIARSTGYADGAVVGTTVANDVRHAFTDCPGEHRIGGCWQRFSSLLDMASDPGGFEELSRTIELARKPRLPVAGNGNANFAQGLASDLLNLVDFLRGLRRFLLDQASRQFTL
jgi:hypothetical protein